MRQNTANAMVKENITAISNGWSWTKALERAELQESEELGSKGAVSPRATGVIAETPGRGAALTVGGTQYILEEIIPPLRVA